MIEDEENIYRWHVCPVCGGTIDRTGKCNNDGIIPHEEENQQE